MSGSSATAHNASNETIHFLQHKPNTNHIQTTNQITDLFQSQKFMNTNNNYTPDIETILENIRRNSIMLSKEHHNRYLYLRDTLKYYRIPIIVISSFSSIVSMGQQFIPQDTITILNTVLSFVCSVIGAIELFMQVSQQMVQEKSASTDYYILASDIYKCLALEPQNRSSDGKTFLEEKYGTYVKLVESSTIVRKNIKDQLCFIPKELKLIKTKSVFKTPIQMLYPPKPKHGSENGNENEHEALNGHGNKHGNELPLYSLDDIINEAEEQKHSITKDNTEINISSL